MPRSIDLTGFLLPFVFDECSGSNPFLASTASSTMNMQSGQDWEPVVFRKKKPTATQSKDAKNVNAVSGGTAVVSLLFSLHLSLC